MMISHASVDEGIGSPATLVESFCALTSRALVALEGGVLEDLEAVLTERTEIILRLDPLLHGVITGQEREAPAGSAFHAVRSRLAAAGELDSRLRLALATQLQALGSELDRMGEEEAIRSAYGRTTRHDGRHINLVR